jgi:hypothetical protein
VIVDKSGIAYSLAAFAQLAAAQKQFKRAATLWGASEKLRQSLRVLPFTSKDQLFTSLMPATRTQLGEDVFVASWADGRRMKLEEAIEYALAGA